MRILIADDDVAIRDSLRMMLEYEGYTVFDAGTGREALALVEQETPDLVLLDVDMPDIGGLDVLKALTLARKGLSVVMISGHASDAIVIEALHAGAVDFLPKPFESTNRLLRTIKSAVTPPGFGEHLGDDD